MSNLYDNYNNFLSELQKDVLRAVDNSKRIEKKRETKDRIVSCVTDLHIVLEILMDEYPDRTKKGQEDKKTVKVYMNPYNEEELIIKSPYDELFLRDLKKTKGRRYIPDKKCWSIPNTEFNYDGLIGLIQIYYKDNPKEIEEFQGTKKTIQTSILECD